MNRAQRGRAIDRGIARPNKDMLKKGEPSHPGGGETNESKSDQLAERRGSDHNPPIG